MGQITKTANFPALFNDDTPLLDVRAPIEFAQGAFPTSYNSPLLNDQERQEVGITYKQNGQQQAINLGESLVSGESRQQRLNAWLGYVQQHPTAHIYCFRGGLRSQTVQQWLAGAGVERPFIEGGYKALRSHLIDSLEQFINATNYIVIAGKTGCAKTHLLNTLTPSIDLEGLANHRGSAFGNRVEGQPTQVNFENQLSIEAIKLQNLGCKRLFIEDESRAIGSLGLPPALHKKMSMAPLAVIEDTTDNRVNTILNDYIVSNHKEMLVANPATGDDAFRLFLTSSFEKIKRRLGGENYGKITEKLQLALDHQTKSGDYDYHRTWIYQLLTHYYDPMYAYQLDKKKQRIVFRGNQQELSVWAAKIACY